MIGFVIGFIVGEIVGVFCICLLMAERRDDDE